MEIFLNPEAWIALLTLTFLEIVLGVDNIIFISIVSNKLPEHQQSKARTIGLALALIVRIIMLMGISYIIGFTAPLFETFCPCTLLREFSENRQTAEEAKISHSQE